MMLFAGGYGKHHQPDYNKLILIIGFLLGLVLGQAILKVF